MVKSKTIVVGANPKLAASRSMSACSRKLDAAFAAAVATAAAATPVDLARCNERTIGSPCVLETL